MLKKITSGDNPHVKTIKALVSDSKERRKRRQFIAEGFRTCSTLIENGTELVTLYVLENVLQRVIDMGVDQEQVMIVSQFVMDKMSPSTTPSGVLGLFAMPEAPAYQDLSYGIVCADITDPGNMGTLIRTAVAMGAQSVVCVEGVDPFNPKVIQASAGTIAQIKIFQWSWDDLLAHKKALVLYALVTHGGKEPRAINAQTALIVVGNEARGIPEGWLKTCDSYVTVAMPGNAESLNAAVAGSIALYLVFGQR